MNLSTNRLLIVFSFLLFSFPIKAQLPIRHTRWKGTVMAPSNVIVLLTFRNDSLLLTELANNRLLETMRYQQRGDTVRILKVNGESPCTTDVIGSYRLEYTHNGEQISLRTISDECPERQAILSTNKPFERVRTKPNQPLQDWPYLDPTADSIAGISLYRAYDLLKGRKSVPVVVGVVDSGIDIAHEDLRDVIWINPRETPGNNTDDDRNGYIDDLNGWNFMGTKDGVTYEYGQPEITQTYTLLKGKYDQANRAKLSPTEKRQYDTYQIAKKQFLQRYRAVRGKRLAFADTARFWLAVDRIRALLPDSMLSPGTIRSVDPGNDSVAIAVRNLLADAYYPAYGSFTTYTKLIRQNWARFRQITASDADIAYNPDYEPSRAVGDNPADLTERYYGSPTLRIGQSQELAAHGSHVAGIIGAKRANGRGIDGVADNVRIMMVAVVPANGDERDKDVANGIRYAVENGAKVINMSFGKRLSPFKEQVDAAIRFAEEHDVLVVHAAGNNGENVDSMPAYPSARYENGQIARNVIVVGNNTSQLNESLAAQSSNYGLQTVDLFAPGTDILSTIPNNQYAVFSGTSMAAPHTAGVAALLRSYFPKLTAVQVKEILLKSSYKPVITVRKPGRASEKVPFNTLSGSGGLLNAYKAVKMILSEPEFSGFK